MKNEIKEIWEELNKIKFRLNKLENKNRNEEIDLLETILCDDSFSRILEVDGHKKINI